MSILSGPAIIAARECGDIEIDPFDEKMVNPASVDLTLGSKVLVYRLAPRMYDAPPAVLDSKAPAETHELLIPPTGFIVQPGVGYLMHTVERIGSRRYVPILDGKSSLGRLFVQVHATAGYGDPGFFGQWTLEVTVTHPVRLYAGMRIAQMRFHVLGGEVKLYSGNYKDDAVGPVPSRAWKQFES